MAKWASIPATALGFVKSTSKSLLKILETDNQFLESIQVRFWAMIRELREGGRYLEVTCFFEDMPLVGVGRVVSKESATLEGYNQISIHANHRDMVKFGSAADNGFKRLLGELIRWDSQIRTTNSNSNTYILNEKNHKCLEDLQTTNPCDDKTRIEQTRGGLLHDSYRWILDNVELRGWRDDLESRLLWAKGDPGKGKTMLLCGIIDELQRAIADSGILSFFCQATDTRINSATAVLRGLIYLLVVRQPCLILHIRKEYDCTGKSLFEDTNAWFALSRIFTNIFQDQTLERTYLIVDALDECQTDLPQLLNFFVQESASSRLKWVVSSHNLPDIEQGLQKAGEKVALSLELNAESVSTAVNIYIQWKVEELADIQKYNLETRNAVQHHLSSNAHGTFLWVVLVCQNLKGFSSKSPVARLNRFSPGLDSLYKRMMEQICSLIDDDDVNLCKRILALVTTVYRPITLKELMFFIKMPEDDLDVKLETIIGLCGSFLTLRAHTVYFVHQSAKDFLL